MRDYSAGTTQTVTHGTTNPRHDGYAHDRHALLADDSLCDVWSVSLRSQENTLPGLEHVLSPEERQRADAFLLPAPRRQFVIVRAALRTILAGYLRLPARTLRFETNEWGKPALTPASDLRFNVSHAGELALIAVARGFDPGIDIERHRPLPDASAMARMVLCAEDLAGWEALATNEKLQAFYRIWTCKEAVSKALGRGLSMDFQAIRISLDSQTTPRLEAIGPGWGSPDQWSLLRLEVEDGYTAALAAATPNLRMMRHTLDW